MSPTLDCPRLRPGLAAAKDSSDPRFVFLWDQLRLNHEPQRLTIVEFMWVQMLDGRRTLREIQCEAMKRTGGELLPLEWLVALIAKLDQALFLDSPRFREYVDNPVREPTCIGCYESEPEALRKQLTDLFTDSHGPGLPGATTPDGRLRAALIPHIDYQRGGTTYAWGFKEVFQRTDASLFVIIGTSHYSSHRFTLTRKDFKTPLGIAPTDQDYISRLSAHYGDGLFNDELAHLPEHSIELEVVFLQYWYDQRRPFRIVPLVVGPFQDSVAADAPPASFADVGRMIEALRRTERDTPEPICYIISGDLAHIGPKFGDLIPVNEPLLAHSRQQDQLLLEQFEAADPARFYRVIADESDCRRICGFPPGYTFLEAVRPRRGQVLHYDQYVHPRGFESVSFASVAFYE
jgi:AmmeMemoRadiSam system protein B